MDVIISKSEGVWGNKGRNSYKSEACEFQLRLPASALGVLKRVLNRRHMLPKMLPLTVRNIINICKITIKIHNSPFMITGGAFESMGPGTILFRVER
tara:strand:+ start:232 stop:522 length:291 start_codon:yes stop_codon:yes gene_type:complete